MQKVAEACGANLTLIDNGFDPAKQFANIQDAITTGNYDAFIIVTLDNAGIVPVVEDAIEAGIKVIATDTSIGPDLTTSDIQVDGVSGSILRPASLIAEDQAAIILEQCADKDPCTVVWIPGALATAFDQALKAVFDQLAADNPNINFIVGPEGGYLSDPAFTAMQDILQANDQIDVVASADQMILGAEKAIEDAGRTGEMLLVGGGASEPAVAAVAEGRWYATPTFVPRDDCRGHGDGDHRRSRRNDREPGPLLARLHGAAAGHHPGQHGRVGGLHRPVEGVARHVSIACRGGMYPAPTSF